LCLYKSSHTDGILETYKTGNVVAVEEEETWLKGLSKEEIPPLDDTIGLQLYASHFKPRSELDPW